MRRALAKLIASIVVCGWFVCNITLGAAAEKRLGAGSSWSETIQALLTPQSMHGRKTQMHSFRLEAHAIELRDDLIHMCGVTRFQHEFHFRRLNG
jgi:hypothetical protein